MFKEFKLVDEHPVARATPWIRDHGQGFGNELREAPEEVTEFETMSSAFYPGIRDHYGEGVIT